MSISGISSYQSQSIFAVSSVNDIQSSNRQAALTKRQSSGDTVNISLDAKRLADIAAKDDTRAAALEGGSAQLKMFGDPTSNPITGLVYIPEAVVKHMPSLDRRIATLADLENYNNGLISDSKWAELQQGVIDSHAAVTNGAKAKDTYKKAMRQFGIDYDDPESLYAFSKNPEQIKRVDELFQGIMG